jgi:hypothetical protein
MKSRSIIGHSSARNGLKANIVNRAAGSASLLAFSKMDFSTPQFAEANSRLRRNAQ